MKCITYVSVSIQLEFITNKLQTFRKNTIEGKANKKSQKPPSVPITWGDEETLKKRISQSQKIKNLSSSMSQKTDQFHASPSPVYTQPLRWVSVLFFHENAHEFHMFTVWRKNHIQFSSIDCSNKSETKSS